MWYALSGVLNDFALFTIQGPFQENLEEHGQQFSALPLPPPANLAKLLKYSGSERAFDCRLSSQQLITVINTKAGLPTGVQTDSTSGGQEKNIS